MIEYSPIDSRILLKILMEITSKKSETICKEIGIYDEQIQRFRKGNPQSCFWPPNDTWFKNYRRERGHRWDSEFFDANQKFPLCGEELMKALKSLKKIAKAENLSLEDDYLATQVTLASRMYEYFIDVFKMYIGKNVGDTKKTNDEKAKKLIVDIMIESGVSDRDIAMIESYDTYEEIIEILIKRAKSAATNPLTMIEEEKSVYENMNNIEFKQLSHRDNLSKKQLEAIAALVWESDKYIFPALFGEEQAIELLPLVFSSNKDVMFSLDNIFAAFYQNRIIAIVLHKKGPIKWSSEYLSHLAGHMEVSLSEFLKKTEKEYFSKYNEISTDTTAILNFCIESNYRQYDEENGGKLMRYVLSEFLKYHNESLVLYVLKETEEEMKTYYKEGFEPIRNCSGYSPDDISLPCFFMQRKAVN